MHLVQCDSCDSYEAQYAKRPPRCVKIDANLGGRVAVRFVGLPPQSLTISAYAVRLMRSSRPQPMLSALRTPRTDWSTNQTQLRPSEQRHSPKRVNSATLSSLLSTEVVKTDATSYPFLAASVDASAAPKDSR